jgi:hypothetical protein
MSSSAWNVPISINIFMFYGERWHSVFTNLASQHECWLICLQLCNTDSIKFQFNTEWLTNTTFINAETESLVLIMKVRGTMKCEWLYNGQLNNKCEERNTADIEFVVLQAGLILHQAYIPSEQHANSTKYSHLIQCISWGLEDWQPHPI